MADTDGADAVPEGVSRPASCPHRAHHTSDLGIAPACWCFATRASTITDADLQAIVDAGRGYVPLTELRFRCSQCGTVPTNLAVTSKDVVRPW